MDILTQQCKLCRVIKRVEEFNKNKTTKSGYSSWCRSCISSYNKELYKRDKEEAKIRSRIQYLCKKNKKNE